MKRSLNIVENDFTGISFHGNKEFKWKLRQGITQVVASAGHPVMLYDVAEKHTQDAIEFIGKRLEDSFQKGENN